MPTISRFLGITIRIYYEDHGVPHFHAYYGESEASLAIETLEILEGELPPRVRALVLEWASDRREALRENWQRAKEHSPLRALDPLQQGDAVTRLKKVEAKSGYRLYLEFEDGARGFVDLSDRLFGPMFEPLKDPDLFLRVSLDEFGAVCWPNGADLAPDALWEVLMEPAPPRQVEGIGLSPARSDSAGTEPGGPGRRRRPARSLAATTWSSRAAACTLPAPV